MKTGSFVSAAANLNLTQTAVSARVRVLAQQLNCALFVRACQSVALPPGRELAVTLGAEYSEPHRGTLRHQINRTAQSL